MRIIFHLQRETSSKIECDFEGFAYVYVRKTCDFSFRFLELELKYKSLGTLNRLEFCNVKKLEIFSDETVTIFFLVYYGLLYDRSV